MHRIFGKSSPYSLRRSRRARTGSFLRLLGLLGLLALLALLPGLAAAQEQAPSSAPPLLRADPIRVEDALIRPAEVYQDTPVETEIIDAETLRKTPAVNAIDALEALPGLQVQERVQGQRGAVRIDGLPEEFTVLLVNGQRYGGEIDEAADLGDLLFANVERIEILRGPQALRYSPRAGGGVINIITADPPTNGRPAFGGLAAAGDQDQADFKATAAYGNERIGGSLTYDFQQIGGYDNPNPNSTDFDDGVGSPYGEGSLYRTNDLYASLIARPAPGLELSTRLGYRLRDDAFAIDDGPVESRSENQRWLLSQDVSFDTIADIRAFGTYTYYQNTLDTDVGREFELIDDQHRLELGAERLFEWGQTTHILTLGADLSSNGIDLEEGEFADGIDNDDLIPADLTKRQYRGGFYAIVESEFSDWLASEVGIRREVHSRYAPAWLPSAAILLTPWRWDEERAVKLRFSVGRAIRYPALRELFSPPVAQVGGSYFLAGSRDLAPEKVWALRAGIEINPRRWISATATGFYSLTRNRIRSFGFGEVIQVGEETIPADPGLCPILPIWCTDRTSPVTSPVYRNANLDDIETWGIEARLEFRPHELVEMQFGYTWRETRVSDSNVLIDELPNSPRHVANGRITLTAPVTHTALTLRGQWRDRAIIERSRTGLISFATTEYSNTSFDLDLRLLQPLETWAGFELDVFADLNNVTDNRVIDSYVVRGRSFLVGVRGRFP